MIRRAFSFKGEEPLLTLLATPIGNLDEASPRLRETIASLDLIAAEDTRNAGKLLMLLGEKKPLLACHKFNEKEAAEKIITLIKEGKKVGYMSDAGYPIVSDPGAYLTKRAVEEGIKVTVINGPNAAVMALCLSALPSEHFYFHGFLPQKEMECQKELNALKDYPFTLIFYSPEHRILLDLKRLAKTLGGERQVAICRELTKIHEEVIRGTLEETLSLPEESLKGELVLVVRGKKEESPSLSEEALKEALLETLKELRPKEAIKEVAEKFSLPKNEVYDFYLNKIKE